MNRKLWIQKALTMCSLMALVVTFSMVSLASTGAVAGELTVSGNSANDSFVTVNGEVAKSGRTLSSSSTITTPEGMTATVNFGKLGKVHVSPGTTFAIDATNNSLAGDLTSGSITVLNAAKGVDVRTLNGEVVVLNAGETVTAASSAKQTTPKTASRGAWLILAGVFGGALIAILLATAENNFGSGASTVSPTR